MNRIKLAQSALALFILAIFISLSASAAVAEKNSAVVINSKLWQDRYLASIYAGYLGYDIMHFDNLGEAQVETETLKGRDDIIVLESRDFSIVKKYESYLGANEITSFSTIYFDDYFDLQKKLWDKDKSRKYIVLDPRFGIEAVAAAPYILNNQYVPLFLNKKNEDYVKSRLRSADPSNIIIAGNFPVRLISDLTGTKLTGQPRDNAAELSKLSASDSGQEWGVLTSISEIDLTSLLYKRPIFVYEGDIDTIVRTVRDSTEVTKIEVIGGQMTDLAQEIRGQSRRDLKLMLKYARTYTNIAGMTGKIMTLGTVPFDFPYPDLKLLSVTYYDRLGLFGLKFQNRGNVALNIFSTSEYAGNSFSDEYYHALLPGDIVTIPYEVETLSGDTDKARLATRYGEYNPLLKSILSSTGESLFRLDVEKSTYSLKPQISLQSVEYNDKQGIIYAIIDNPEKTELNVHVEVAVNSTFTVASELTKIAPSTRSIIKIETPYNTEKEILGEKVIMIYYGVDDTLISLVKKVTISPRSDVLTGNFIEDVKGNGSWIAFFMLLIIIILLIFIIWRRKKKKDKERQNIF